MKIFNSTIFFLTSLFIISCSNEEIEDSSIQNEMTDSTESVFDIQDKNNFVSEVDIETLASNIILDNSDKTSAAKGLKKTVKNITPVGKNKANPSYYIINYEGGGFMILSADKRAHPVLAFSEENNFNIEEGNEYPDLLVSWLMEQENYISTVRKEDVITTEDMKDQWKTSAIENYINNTNSIDSNKEAKTLSCTGALYVPVLYATYGPMLSTNWGQGVGYNNFAPDQNCSDQSNDRALTGCVATAMAQIMNYHEYPSSYNWSIMPNKVYTSTASSSGANEISKLMRDAGNSVGMDWGCDESGAKTSSAANALKSTFGYKSANYADIVQSTVFSEISNGYPVIRNGGTVEREWLFFDVYQGGHAWVCDGMKAYKRKIKVQAGRYGYITVCSTSYTSHFNWGWNGSYNGWYTSNNPGSYSFNDEQGMIYNIRK